MDSPSGRRSPRARPLGVAALAVVMTACATPAPKPQDSNVAVTTQQHAQPASRGAAERAYQAGNYAQAAGAYARLAERTAEPGPRQRLRIRAAEAFSQAQRWQETRSALVKIGPPLRLSERDTQRLALARARLAVAAQRPGVALAGLRASEPFADDGLEVQAGEARAEAYRQMGMLEDSVRERIRIEPLMADAHARVRNRREIWRTLQVMPKRQIERPPPGLSRSAAGWWALAAAHRIRHRDERRRSLSRWQAAFPRHPGMATAKTIRPPAGPYNPQARRRAYVPPPARRVALLLPLSGPLADVAATVRDGFARAASQAHDPLDYRVYDSAGEPERAQRRLDEAVLNGADLVIGPLRKPAVAALAARPHLAVPVLALNEITAARVPVKLFQFALNPEHAAQAAAERARATGHARAAVLGAGSDAARRLARAFVERFERLGGRVIARHRYPPGSDNLSAHVQALLRPPAGTPLWQDTHKPADAAPSEPRVDMIFVTGGPRDVRLIRPLLRFHDAIELPVYASAEVYNARTPRLNRDLEGLVFCDQPGVLDSERRNAQGVGSVDSTRLADLGADAHLLAGELRRLAMQPGTSVQGETGRLSLTADGHLRRELDCAVFRAGVPQRLDTQPTFSISRAHGD